MSNTLLVRLSYLNLFKGVPSYDREIAQIMKDLQPHGGVEGLAAELDELEGELEGLELNGEVTDRSLGALTNLYVDAAAGDDANDGAAASSPIKTFERLLELINRIDAFTIYVEGELIVDRRASCFGYLNGLSFVGSGAGSSLRFVDFENVVGGFYMSAGGFLSFSDINLVDDTSQWLRPIYGIRGSYHVRLFNVTVSDGPARAASAKTATLMHFPALDLFAQGVSVDTASGKVLETVAAGGNPNSHSTYRSNTTVLG